MELIDKLLVSGVSDFTENHGAFNLDLMKRICKANGYKILVFSKEDIQDVDYLIKLPKHINFGIKKEIEMANTTIGNEVEDLFWKWSNDKKINNLILFFEYHFWNQLKPIREISNKVFSFQRIVLKSVDRLKKLEPEDEREMYLSLEQQMIEESDYVLIGSNGIKCDVANQYQCNDKLIVVPTYSGWISNLNTIERDINVDSTDLIFVGRTDYQKGYWRLKSNKYHINHITPNVRIFEHSKSGPLKNWHEKLNGEIFILFPALYETRGIILQEAMALGMIPLVDKRSSGLAEQTVDGENGFIVDFNISCDDIIENIRTKFSDIQLLTMAKQNKIRTKNMLFENSFANLNSYYHV